ncbi:transposase [Sulfuriroseicoccus oceanibius]|uniref:Uncharacterized protein n=1 Tax=Sulfuriroseicoccus oceanibius TaxID=2707525 RepID=A0A6B3LDR1_9BACT|nr:transposase [Sulfuriroseicoccus oceanibius]QQL45277.1 hypothetical protein G3M56_001440 [Sulfuriroseicoccus oceanibius]
MDATSGQDFSHRRQWVVDRLEAAADSFAIAVYGYAVMENHFHVVLQTKVSRAREWTDREVVDRWLRLYPHTRNDAGDAVGPSDEELAGILSNKEKVALWRSRLSDLGWVMKYVKEPIARASNKEDGVTGVFWQGRFKSQRLDDEGAVAACLVYVDLNPVRARVAATPEQSAFTSVAVRAQAEVAREVVAAAGRAEQPTEEQRAELNCARQAIAGAEWLAPIGSVALDHEHGTWGVSLEEYLALVDVTGRRIRSDKRGAIDPGIAPILERLELDAANWVASVERFGGAWHLVAANLSLLAKAAVRVGRKWFCGRRPAVLMYFSDG